jgi:hypothetical protein
MGLLVLSGVDALMPPMEVTRVLALKCLLPNASSGFYQLDLTNFACSPYWCLGWKEEGIWPML